MKVERNRLLMVLSEALDSVEEEVFGAKTHHARRVALMCQRMAKQLQFNEWEQGDLIVCALLHDNALVEYRNDYENGRLRSGISGQEHCLAGEKNLQAIPFYQSSRGFVLYHHERADGKGPFGKNAKETSLGAQLIHIADEVDVQFALGALEKGRMMVVRKFIRENQGILFSEEACNAFEGMLTEEMLACLQDEQVENQVLEVAEVWVDIKDTKLRKLAELFAGVIDCKSSFTKKHSLGVAAKAEEMARFYCYDEETVCKMYVAGALHDIGKLMVHNDILEKPGRLTAEEYRKMQEHAYGSWRLLRKIPEFSEITEWACYHHEKLNGKGYPFGKTAAELSPPCRLMACVDIYQALTEKRSYKSGMTHTATMKILREMADKGELDRTIVEDMDKVLSVNGVDKTYKCG